MTSSGPFDLVEADRFGVDQAVVLGEGRTAAALERRRRDQRHQRRIDVDLLDRLAAVLRPFDVDADGGEQDQADDRRGDVARDAHADQAVGQHEDDDAADHRAPDGALAAGKRDAAEHDGGQRLEFPADARWWNRCCSGARHRTDRRSRRACPTAHRSRTACARPECRHGAPPCGWRRSRSDASRSATGSGTRDRRSARRSASRH